MAWSSGDLFRQYFRLHSLLSCLLDTQWVNPLPEDLLKRVTEQRARLEELGKNRPEEHKQELNRGAKQEEHKEAEGPKPEAKPEKRRGRCLCVVLLLLFAVAAVFGVSWAACETKMAVSGREREVLEAVCVPYEKGVEVVSDVAEVARTWWEKEVVMEKPAEKEEMPEEEDSPTSLLYKYTHRAPFAPTQSSRLRVTDAYPAPPTTTDALCPLTPPQPIPQPQGRLQAFVASLLAADAQKLQTGAFAFSVPAELHDDYHYLSEYRAKFVRDSACFAWAGCWY
mgnify:CR=1 FL=1